VTGQKRGRGGHPGSPKDPRKATGTTNGTDAGPGPQGDEPASYDPFAVDLAELRKSASYTYEDEDGQKLFQVRKKVPGDHGKPKSFSQFRWTGTRWVAGLNGTRPVLFRLPQVLEAVEVGATIHLAEGERDVLSLVEAGEVATCNPAGAGKWRPEFSEVLRGADVVVHMDNDEAGRLHARQVHDSLSGVARSVRIVRAATGKDITDHLKAGRSLADEVPVEAAALPLVPAAKAKAGAAETTVHVPKVLRDVLGALALNGQVLPPTHAGGDWQVCCPVHEDTTPSATVKVGTERPVVFHCHRGCTQAQFLEWAKGQGISNADLMDKKGPSSTPFSTSWTPVDLAAVMSGEVIEVKPTLMLRSDGVPLLYPGRMHAVNSEPEAGKTWLALFVAAEVMRSGGYVLYVDFEDSAAGIVDRLRSFGLPDEMVGRLFIYVRPDEPFDANAKNVILAVLKECQPHLTVLDGITEAMSLHSLSIKDNDDSAKFMMMLPRLIANTGSAVLQLDHVTKSKDERGRWAIGAQHKLAAIDGVSFSLEARQPFGRGMSGVSTLKVHKDRPGYVRPQGGAVFALRSEDGGAVTAELLPPDGGGGWSPAQEDYSDLYLPICTALSKVVDLSTKDVKSMVTGQNARIGWALADLERLGYIAQESGPHGAKMWRLVRPYEPEGEK
jgi:hypothetical protein